MTAALHALLLLSSTCPLPPPVAGAPSPSPLLAPDGTLPSGTRLTARLTQPIGTSAALGPDRRAELTRRGEPFRALLVTPVVDGARRTRLPSGALVEGRITELSRGQGVRPARVELAVERVCGRPLRGAVVDPPIDRVANARTQRSMEGATTFWLLLGALAFGVPGLALGGTVGNVGGAVAQSHATVNDAWLAAGSDLIVELRAPMRVGPTCRCDR